jgi:hypothetical protein
MVEDRRTGSLLAGGLIGLLIAGSLAATSMLPPAMANEEPALTLLKTADEIFPEDLNADDFFKPNWTIEDSVSTEILSEQVIRKIEFGRTTFVRVVTTASGTYSSDAVDSPYIQYPGIHNMTSPRTADAARVLGAWDGKSWTILRSFGANSFTTLVPFEGGTTLIYEGGVCAILKDGSVYC